MVENWCTLSDFVPARWFCAARFSFFGMCLFFLGIISQIGLTLVFIICYLDFRSTCRPELGRCIGAIRIDELQGLLESARLEPVACSWPLADSSWGLSFFLTPAAHRISPQ